MAEEQIVGEGTIVTKVETPEVKEEQKESSTSETKEYSEIEQEAMEQGWDPDYEGDNKRSAREFVDRGELLGKIKSQSQEIREVKKLAEALSDHNKKVYIASYEKALKDLQEAKVKALDDEEHGKLVKLDEAISDTRTALADMKKAPVVVTPTGESETFKEFKKNNPLYTKDEDFKDWAHGVAISYAKAHDNATEAQVYEFITERAKKKYPDQFRKGPPSPDGEGRNSGGNSTSKGGSKDFDILMNGLPEDQARVAKDLVKRGYVTKEKYVEDYNNIPR